MHVSLLTAAAAALVASAPASAQVTPARQASGEALILVPFSLTKLADLDFGTVVTSSTSGSVFINATTGARTFSGGVTGVTSAAGNRARFAGAGSPNQMVVVTMNPPTELVSLSNPADKVEVAALTLEGSAIKTVHSTNRTLFFGIGGIINIAADQPEGDYEATFDVTANYL